MCIPYNNLLYSFIEHAFRKKLFLEFFYYFTELHYKMLGFNSETTTKEIVSAALEKSNLTEDPKQYAIHEISNSGGRLYMHVIIIILHMYEQVH